MSSVYLRSLHMLGTSVKRILPDELRHYKVMFGICRGNYLPMNLRRNIRVKFGIYEPEIAGYVRRYATPGSCCYDIGAQYGYYTLALARLARPGRVYSFEANRDLCAKLMETLALNPELKSSVEVVNTFLAEQTDPGTNRASIDHLVFEQGLMAPDFIKMDIDGPEYEVLRGASRVLRERRPRLVVETHSPELEVNCKRLLEEAGYAARIIKNNPLLGEHRPIELNRWLTAQPL